MKIIAVFFDQADKDGYPLNEEEYATSYREFNETLHRKDAQLVIVRSQESYMGGNTFNGGWKYQHATLEKVEGVINADIILNKGNLISDASAVVINPLELDLLCTDKSQTYAYFPECSPKTITVTTQKELVDACAVLCSPLVVAKPLNKAGGEGVIIGNLGTVITAVSDFPYLLQEFIDTSDGIPGITAGRHDFRIVSIAGEIMQVYYRSPPKDGYIANLHFGGTLHFLCEEDIPEGAMCLFKAIDEKLSIYPDRVYSVDMGLNRDGRWMLIELNAKPGLRWRAHGNSAILFQERLADLLLRVADECIAQQR